MARPLRVNVKGGWYHVTARGLERRRVFSEERDHEHFLELLAEMGKRYGVEIHAYALMGNHYHLLVKAPSANASAAVQWLNVSYSVWFNKKRDRTGHVFGGRFGSVLIDGEGSWALNASVYVHLNPVRVAGLGLGKSSNRAEAMGLATPDRKELKRRLKVLRECRWSSFRAYAGYEKAPEWLTTDEMLKRGGGRRAYRRYVQEHVTRGIEPEGYEDVRGRLALGTREFQDKVADWVGRVTGEQPGRKQLRHLVDPVRIVKLVQRKRGESWRDFSERHGDWTRDAVFYLTRKRSGLTLGQIGRKLGRIGYKTVGKAVQRFEAGLSTHRTKRRFIQECLDELSLVET